MRNYKNNGSIYLFFFRLYQHLESRKGNWIFREGKQSFREVFNRNQETGARKYFIPVAFGGVSMIKQKGEN